MSCKNCKKNRKRTLKEQYPGQGKDVIGMGGTNTSSSGQYISGGAWDQKGEFFKTRRETPKTEVKEVDITDGSQEYMGYTKGLSIDDIPKDNQVPKDNIKQTNEVGPQYTITTKDNGYRDPYDNDNPDPYDNDNPDPYDRKRPDPKKTKPEKAWRSPPCCRPCGGGKWKRDCGELERAPGSKKSKSTGCMYNSYSDCQLVKKSVNEETNSESSGQYDSAAAWELGGILTKSTGLDMVGSETLLDAPEIGMADDFDDEDITVISIDDLGLGPNSLEDLFDGGENMVDDDINFSIEELVDDEEDEEDMFYAQLQENIISGEQNRIKNLYRGKPNKNRTIKESISDIRKKIRKMV